MISFNFKLWNRTILLFLLIPGSSSISKISMNPTPAAQKSFGEIVKQVDIASVLDLPPGELNQIKKNLEEWKRKYSTSSVSKSNHSKSDEVGRALENKVQQMSTIVATAEKFKSCLRNKEGKGSDILNMLGQVDSELFDHQCSQNNLGNVSEISAALSSAQYIDFGKKMVTQARKNAAENMADMMYKVREKSDESHRDIANSIVATLCPQKKRCDAREKTAIYNAALAHLESVKRASIPARSLKETAQHFNDQAKSLNRFLDAPILPEPNQPIEVAAHNYYDMYETNYYNFISSGAGLLAYSPSMRDSFGQLQGYDGYKKSRTISGTYSLKATPHFINTTEWEVKNARSEYLHNMAMLSVEMEKLTNKANKEGATPEEIKKAMASTIYAYPMAAAQLIASDLAYAGIVCDLANEADFYEASLLENKDWWNYSTQIAGGVLATTGIGLSFTGIGAIVGVPMALAGGALSASSATYDAVKLRKASKGLDDVVKGLTSGSNDQSALKSEVELREKISAEAAHLAMDAGFTMTGAAGVIKGLKEVTPLMKMSGAKGHQGLKAIYENRSHVGTISTLRRQMGEERVSQMVGKLAGLSQSQRDSILGQLTTAVKAKKASLVFANFEKALKACD